MKDALHRHRFTSIKKTSHHASGVTFACHAVHYTNFIVTHDQLLEQIRHEDIHIEINKNSPKKTTEKQDHFIMQRMETEWF